MANKRKVQLETGVDATGARKGFADIKDASKDMAKAIVQDGQSAAKGVEGIGTGSDAAAAKVERSAKSITAQIQRLTAEAQAGGKNTSAYFEARAKQLGIDPARLNEELAGLKKIEAAQKAAQGTTSALGVSAGQTKAALAQLPAQFTDIVTSLQGGQKPFTVLLQQGGQIKDSFGGAGNAARALGSYVLGLVNPFTVAAAAAAGLGFAFLKGRADQEEFAKTVILTGGAAGQTADQLASMALTLSEIGAGTRGRAAEVLNQIAQDSSIGAGNLQRFTAAALKLEQVGGPAAEATAQAFSSLAKSPLESALKLNAATNFLTRSVYDQIKSFDEQGRAVDAASVAQAAYADALENRTPKLLENLGLVERAWISIKNGIKGAADELLGIGRSQTDDQKLASLRAQLAALEGGSGSGTQLNPQAQQRQDAAIEAKKAQLRAQIASGEASVAAERTLAAEQRKTNEELKKRAQFDKDGIPYLTRRQQLEREIAKARNEAPAGASPAEINKRVAAIREKFDPGIPSVTAESGINAAKRQLGLLTSAFSNAEAVLAAQRQAGLISESTYYDTKRTLIEADRNAQVNALQAESAGIAEKNQSDKLTTAERIANADKLKDNAAKILDINAKAATSVEVLGTQQTSALNGIAKAYAEAKNSAEDYLATLVRTQQRDLDLFGASSRTRRNEQGRNQIADRYQQERQRIQNDRALTAIQQGGTLTSDQAEQFNKQLKLNREFEAKALESYSDYVDQRTKLEGDFTQGAGRAFRNYLDDAADVAKQTEQLFTNAFGGIEDALVKFVTTGKLDFKSLADSIISDLLRIAIQQAIISPIKAAATAFFGFANGGAFDSSGEIRRFASGDVFDQPTAFSYGGGKRGELGEAGPEAIMPLTRGAGGKLGVVAHGGSSGGLYLNFQPTYAIDGTADKAQSLAQMQQVASQSQKDLLKFLNAKGVV